MSKKATGKKAAAHSSSTPAGNLLVPLQPLTREESNVVEGLEDQTGPLSQTDNHQSRFRSGNAANGASPTGSSRVSFRDPMGALVREESNPYRAPSAPNSQGNGKKDPSSSTNAKLFPKTIHDRVHDQITLHPLLVEIIDTVQFQRLRSLHQLGPCRLLFPGATHTRFEHSVGVAHLAMKMARQLKENHEQMPPCLDISHNDILCLGIAGLCHDLGHGPYSHLFEGYVNARRAEKAKETGATFTKWHHEAASKQLLDYLITENRIDFERHGLHQTDLNFIKLLIGGIRSDADWPSDIGREEDKRYLFDIVANKRNGIDVDKLDYFLRDHLSCYGKLPETNLDRIFHCARVIEVEGSTQVCYQEKIALGLGDLFALRAKMHKYVYQHRITKCTEEMVMDAMRLSEGHFTVEVSSGEKLSLSECVDNMEAYSKVGDWVIEAIFLTGDQNLAAARDVIRRLKERKFYELVGHYVMKNTPQLPGAADHLQRQSTGLSDTPVISPEDIVRIMINDATPEEKKKLAESMYVTKARITYGSSGDKPGDPLNHVRFFNPKQNPDVGFPLNPKRMSNLFSPTEFLETTVMLFTKDMTNAVAVNNAFTVWRALNLNGKIVESIPCINASPSSAMKKESRKRDRDSEPPGFCLENDPDDE